MLFDMFYCNVSIKYRSTLCSKASLLLIVTTLTFILVPLLLVYTSRGFWLKTYTFYEQPDVKFKYQYLFIGEGENGIISCSNIQNISKIGINDDCYSIQVLEEDFNSDNKIDEIHFKLQSLNLDLQEILTLSLYLILDYKVHTTCPMQMEGMVAVSAGYGLPISKYFLTANLKLSQSFPLPCWHNYEDTRYNYSIIPEYNELTVTSWIEHFLYEYSRRNVSTSISNVYAKPEHGISDSVTVTLSLAIPEHPVRYRPGLSQEIKHFWQQYISIALVFYWLMYKLNSYIFTNKLVPTWERIPWKKY